jgi:hypothetical protein
LLVVGGPNGFRLLPLSISEKLTPAELHEKNLDQAFAGVGSAG